MTDSKKELQEVLAREARAGKLSRRDFMRHAVAAGMTVPLASSLWVGQVAAATPQKGGKFRVGVHDMNTSDTLDPGKYQSVGEIQLAHAFRSYLTEITSENGLGPDMAKSWSATPDAKTWTFELDPNATFHNGKKFTSKDAVASLNHHRGENTTSAAKALLTTVTDVKAMGDHAIEVKLDQGFADLPWVMTDYHLTMLPAKDDGTIDWESGIGAGPYAIEEHTPGVGTKLKRHDGWHRDGAHFDEVEMIQLNDPNARQTALLTGEVDAITSVDLKTLALMARNPNIEVDNVPSGSAITLPMFCDVAPFDNVDVRLALKHAIDREDIVEKIMFGTATPGNDFHVSPGMPYWPDIEQRTYDPDKAKFHLKKAGHGKPQRRASRRPTACCRVRLTCAFCSRSVPRQAGIEHQGEARAQRRLLVRRVAQEAVRVREVGRTPDAGQHVHPGLQGRCALERGALEASALQRAAAAGEGRTQRHAARGNVPRDVPDRPRRRRLDHSDLHQLRLWPPRQRHARRKPGGELGERRRTRAITAGGSPRN